MQSERIRFLKNKFLLKIISKKKKIELFENLSVLLQSGISISDALNALKEDSEGIAIKFLIDEIEKSINNGNLLWKTIKKYQILPAYLIPVLEIGEESGNLPENLNIIINQIKKDQEFTSKFQSASLYPLIIFILMIIIGTGISVFILPQITDLYEGLNIELPLATKIIVEFSEIMQGYWYIIIPTLITVLYLIYFFLFRFKYTKFIGQAIMLQLPIFKKVIIEFELARFGTLFGTLQKNGFPVEKSLTLLSNSTGIVRYKNLYIYLQKEIEDGSSFKNAFENYKGIKKIMPMYVRQVISTAEKTGTLDKGLKKVGDRYEKLNSETIKNLSVIIEPALLILIWVGVALIALAVILPVYSLTGNVTNFSNTPNQTSSGEIRKPSSVNNLE